MSFFKFFQPRFSPVWAVLVATLLVSGCASSSNVAGAPRTTPPPAAIAVSVNPTSVSVQTTQSSVITATVQNDTQNKGVTWTLTGVGCSGAACGAISSTSTTSGIALTYTAPASAPTSPVTLTATSVADGNKAAAVTITVSAQTTGSVAITISPKRSALTTGQSQTFTASVTGSTNTSVNWQVDSITGGNSTVGTISAAGVFTPASSPGPHTITAQIAADVTATASASVAITDLAGVYTYHNDLSRDGQNSKEYALTNTTVSAATFGKLFACPIDASAYAQPLWIANVAIAGGTHNVVFATTQHDTVYLFDADASPCQTYWTKSLLPANETWVTSTDVGSMDLTPDIGIVGTPVIDPATNTIYLDAKSKDPSPAYHHRLHALSLLDGSEKFSGPVEITATVGNSTFDPLHQNQRGGLARVNGTVYITYGSHGDQPVYYGWLLGYNASTLAQTSVFNTEDPANAFGGIWMSGGAPASDAGNNLYVLTGNGKYDGATLWGDSFLKLSPGLSVVSFFTPSSQGTLNSGDIDLGSGGALLVARPGSPHPNLAIGGGKEGILYLLDQGNLGGNTITDAGALQLIPTANEIFGTPAFWQNSIYLAPVNETMTGHLLAYTFDAAGGLLNPLPSSQSTGVFAFPGPTPSISSQGTANGIVWAIERVPSGAAILHAYDATNVGTELWNSAAKGTDQAGPSVKFTVPTVANGKVYVGTANEITVYGLAPN